MRGDPPRRIITRRKRTSARQCAVSRREVAAALARSTLGVAQRANRRAIALGATRALPPRLKQADSAGNRDVEALDRAVHRYLRQLVAGFARESTQPITLSPQHPGERSTLVD